MRLEEKVERFWAYLDAKRAERDAHGVWDAAIEIAILEGRLKQENIMTDVVTEVKAAAAAVAPTVAKGEAELGFVRANWGKLSAIVVAAAAIGFVVGTIL
jgi:hypothetical protein